MGSAAAESNEWIPLDTETKKMTKRIRDITDFGTVAAVNNNLASICTSFSNLEKAIARESDLNAAVTNILDRVQYYLGLLDGRALACIELDSWISRNIFELLVITKAILQDGEYLRSWMGQRAKDEIDILTEVIRMANGESNANVDKLNGRISELTQIAGRHGIELKKQFNMADLSRSVGLEPEYLTNYKTLSKLTHPSSYSVNASPDIRDDLNMKNRTIVMLQLHLGILYKLVADFYKVDDSDYGRV